MLHVADALAMVLNSLESYGLAQIVERRVFRIGLEIVMQDDVVRALQLQRSPTAEIVMPVGRRVDAGEMFVRDVDRYQVDHLDAAAGVARDLRQRRLARARIRIENAEQAVAVLAQQQIAALQRDFVGDADVVVVDFEVGLLQRRPHRTEAVRLRGHRFQIRIAVMQTRKSACCCSTCTAPAACSVVRARTGNSRFVRLEESLLAAEGVGHVRRAERGRVVAAQEQRFDRSVFESESCRSACCRRRRRSGFRSGRSGPKHRPSAC